MNEDEPERDRQQQLLEAVLKVVGIALAIGLVIGIGTWALVKSLDLDTTEVGPIGAAPSYPVQTLPSSALPQPTDGGPDLPEPTGLVTEGANPDGGNGKLFLSASPVFVEAMERINLTGQWPGRDATSLVVQRFEDGDWVDFGVSVQVEIGTFDTYVLTGREGDNKFRVYDPATESASNAVTITVE